MGHKVPLQMAEATVTPSPAPTAQAPAAPTTPGAEGATPPTVAPTKPTDTERSTKLEEQARNAARERMKLSHEARIFREERTKFETERAEYLKLKQELDARKAEEEGYRRNPAKLLKAKFGENWKDTVAQVSISEAATPELLASEVEDTKAYFQRQLEERDKKWEEKFAERDSQSRIQEQETARQGYEANALSYLKANEAKYPLVHAYNQAEKIGAYIMGHFTNTMGKDEITGEPTQGELLTPEEAASKMEAELKQLDERVTAAKAKTQAATPNGAAPGEVKPQATQRRTLSTSMTSRAPAGFVPPKDDSERRKRALAAMEAALAPKH